MKNFIAPFGLAAFLLTGSLAWTPAQAQTISGPQTTQQTLSSGTLNVLSAGSITVTGSPSVLVTGTSTIINSGSITGNGNGGRGIDLETAHVPVNIVNNVGGIVTSNGDDAIHIEKSSDVVVLTNSGTIQAIEDSSHDTGQAIDFSGVSSGSNALNNTSTGVIQATGSDAVRMGANGVLHNDGLIQSINTSDNNTGNDGLDMQANSGVIIVNAFSTASGTIEGARHGITGGQTSAGAAFTMSITNNTGGTIEGNNGSGINIDGFYSATAGVTNELITINNAGLITGNGSTLTGTEVSQDGDGVDVDGLVNLTNSGTIKSINAIGDVSEGVTVGGGTITNSGTIEGSGTTGRGITLAGMDKDNSSNPVSIQKIYANSTITNSGLIKGDTDAGIAILGISGSTNFSVTITNTAGGIIEGGGSVAAIDGSSNPTGSGGGTSANNETVINYGTIEADTSNTAINLGMGNNLVDIEGGSAVVTGDISGGTLTGTNTAALIINPTGTSSFSYGGALSNFTSVTIQSGTVTLSGTNTYTGATAVTGGKLAVNGSVTSNVTVSSGAEVGGHGTISGTISGGGAVGPGNSPGILTASSVDPHINGSLSFNFELTQTGSATWSNAASSGNDVLHLTGSTPIVSALTSANTINLYFSALNLTYQGGFFVEGSTDTLTAKLASANFDYFVLDNTNGTVTYNGNKYDQVTGTASTIQVTGANFGTGTVNGFTEQFTAQAVPEPATYLMLGLGALVMVLVSRRRNNRVG